MRLYVDDPSDSFGKGNKQISNINGNQMPINGLIPDSQNKDGYQMPIYGLILVSQNKDGYRMPINGLTLVSQNKENKCNKQEETSCQ